MHIPPVDGKLNYRFGFPKPPRNDHQLHLYYILTYIAYLTNIYAVYRKERINYTNYSNLDCNYLYICLVPDAY